MPLINYSTEQQNKANRYALTPDYFGYNTNDDVADDVVLGTADTYVIFKPDISHLDVFASDEFSYNDTTGEITYTGSGEFYALIGNVTIGSSVINNIVHFSVFINGVYKFDSAAKVESVTGLVSLGLSAPFNVATNDVITIRIKASEISTVRAYHSQGFIHELKPSVHS